VPRVLFTLSRDYEEWGGPTRFLRPEGRAWATNDQARSDDDGNACRWASKQGNPTNPRNHAPPLAPHAPAKLGRASATMFLHCRD
jgi:hypothetical protein